MPHHPFSFLPPIQHAIITRFHLFSSYVREERQLPVKRKSFPCCREPEYQDVFLFPPHFRHFTVFSPCCLSSLRELFPYFLHFVYYPRRWWHGHWLQCIQGSRIYPLACRAASIKPPQLHLSKAWWNIFSPVVGINLRSELKQIPLCLCKML